MIKIGDNVVPYHPDFRFYMTSKLANPHYPPEVSVKVSLLNFFVTSEGLEEQLLDTTVVQVRQLCLSQLCNLRLYSSLLRRATSAFWEGCLICGTKNWGPVLCWL